MKPVRDVVLEVLEYLGSEYFLVKTAGREKNIQKPIVQVLSITPSAPVQLKAPLVDNRRTPDKGLNPQKLGKVVIAPEKDKKQAVNSNSSKASSKLEKKTETVEELSSVRFLAC